MARHPFGVRIRLALLYGVLSALVGVAPIGLVCVLIEHNLGNTVTAVAAQTGIPVYLQPAQAHGKTTPLSHSQMTAAEDPGNTLVLVASCAATTKGQSGMQVGICNMLPSDSTPPPTNYYSGRTASVSALRSGLAGQLVWQFLFYSGIALAALVLLAFVLLAFALGWWLAGRALRPVHRMAAAARELSATNPHGRIPLDQPKDELRELGETFNGLLDRLGTVVAGQQRFIANAAHELRTPLAIQRTAIQIGLGELPEDTEELATVREDLLTANRRYEQLINGLLMLARGDSGLDQVEPVDLAALTDDVVEALLPEADQREVTVDARTERCDTHGEPVLLRQLITNLVQNAIRHNVPGGHIRIRTSPAGLTVTNTGPDIAENAVTDLFEPFRRLHTDRTGSVSGAGLGLSIVRSIVTAHSGTVLARPNATGGGLTVHVRLPTRVVPVGAVR